jgi:hypothetical protein
MRQLKELMDKRGKCAPAVQISLHLVVKVLTFVAAGKFIPPCLVRLISANIINKG